jgi:hypothetical protein
MELSPNKTPKSQADPQPLCVCPECGCQVENCPLIPGPHPPRHHPHLLNARNTLALLAALCFAVSLFLDEKELLWKAVAYGLGAVAYIGELLAMTHLFHHRCTLRELLMPLLFGFVYIMLGLNYAIKHFI